MHVHELLYLDKSGNSHEFTDDNYLCVMFLQSELAAVLNENKVKLTPIQNDAYWQFENMLIGEQAALTEEENVFQTNTLSVNQCRIILNLFKKYYAKSNTRLKRFFQFLTTNNKGSWKKEDKERLSDILYKKQEIFVNEFLPGAIKENADVTYV